MVVLKKQSESYTYPGFSVATIYHFICPWRSSLLKLRLNHPKISGVFKGAKARTKLSNIAPKDEKLRQGVERLDFYLAATAKVQDMRTFANPETHETPGSFSTANHPSLGVT